MIVAAHIGIGIRGVEGQQAARASDYAIGEFKFLRNLLFVHGRECYRKNSHLVLYNFYKNLICVIPQFWYGFYNFFSGTALYNPYLYQSFNIFFASLPIIVYAIFDSEFTQKTLLATPKLYEVGVKDKLFNAREFWWWVGFAIFQSSILCYFSYIPLESFGLDSSGRMEGFWFSGSFVFTLVIVLVNLKVILFSTQLSVVQFVAVYGSIAIYLVLFITLMFLHHQIFTKL